MKPRKPIKSVIWLFAILIIATFTSCLPDDDLIVDDIRDSFVGTWRFNESPLKSPETIYTVVITKDPGNTSQVLLRNFGNVGNFQTAYGIVTQTRIAIPSQTIASFIISGDGVLSGSTRMEWSYSINDGADLTTYSAVAEKQ